MARSTDSTDAVFSPHRNKELESEYSAASLDASHVLEECAAFCRGLLAGLAVPPSWIGSRARPLPATVTVFARGILLPSNGLPVLPLREVLSSVQRNLRTRWTCGRHWKGVPRDYNSFLFELDNYGNILMLPGDDSDPVYVVRSLVAYNSSLVEVARAVSPTLGLEKWMQRGPALGPVPCDMCDRPYDGGLAAFDGCTADCLPLTASSGSLPAASRLAHALARHTDLVLAPLESAFRRSCGVCETN